MYHNQLAALAQDYCILDTHNLFVCTTLEDEILVLGGKQELLTGLAGQCCNFGFSLEAHRKLLPLIVAAKLHLYVEISRHHGKVVRLHEHIVELKERQTSLSRHPLFESFRSKHLIHVEMCSDRTHKFYVIERT